MRGRGIGGAGLRLAPPHPQAMHEASFERQHHHFDELHDR
jgi:hypothetical protein